MFDPSVRFSGAIFQRVVFIVDVLPFVGCSFALLEKVDELRRQLPSGERVERLN